MKIFPQWIHVQFLDDLLATTSWIVVVGNFPMGAIINTLSLNESRLDLELDLVTMVMKPLKTPTKAAKAHGTKDGHRIGRSTSRGKVWGARSLVMDGQ
jgi:hypothetical protein